MCLKHPHLSVRFHHSQDSTAQCTGTGEDWVTCFLKSLCHLRRYWIPLSFRKVLCFSIPRRFISRTGPVRPMRPLSQAGDTFGSFGNSWPTLPNALRLAVGGRSAPPWQPCAKLKNEMKTSNSTSSSKHKAEPKERRKRVEGGFHLRFEQTVEDGPLLENDYSMTAEEGYESKASATKMLKADQRGTSMEWDWATTKWPNIT